MKKLIILLFLITIALFAGCKSQFGEWFLMDNENEVNEETKQKIIKQNIYADPPPIQTIDNQT